MKPVRVMMLPALCLMLANLCLGDAGSPSLAQQTEQSLSLVSKMIKSTQKSACDGEQLSIQCPDDYVMEVITGVLNVLGPSDSLEAATCDSRGAYSIQSSCSSEESRVLSEAERRIVAQTVTTTCHLRNSCLLHLNSTTQTTETSVNNQPISNTNITNSNSTELETIMAKKLSQVLATKCPGNRKLLEVSYKCRPFRLNKRIACEGEAMKIDCPTADRRIIVPSVFFGSSSLETKALDKCEAQKQQQQHSPSTQSTNTSAAAAAPTASTLNPQYKDCQSTNASAPVVIQCLLNQRCRIQVTRDFLGEPQGCPSSQPLYLKVVYVCVANNMLRDDSFRPAVSVFTPTGGYPPTNVPDYTMVTGQPHLKVISKQQQQHEEAPVSQLVFRASTGPSGNSQTNNNIGRLSLGSRVYQGLILLSGPQYYKLHVIIAVVIGFCSLMLVISLLVWRSNRAAQRGGFSSAKLSTGSSSSGNTKKNSSSSSSTTSSTSSQHSSNASNSSSNSFSTPADPTMALLARPSNNNNSRLKNPLHHKQSGEHKHATLSNSESCFSLDDYNLATDSQSAAGNITPLNSSIGPQYRPYSRDSPGAPDPVLLKPQRLCTIYGHGHERLGGTLRAATQRTFVGRPQPQLHHPHPQTHTHQSLLLHNSNKPETMGQQVACLFEAAPLSWSMNGAAASHLQQQHVPSELMHVNGGLRCPLHQSNQLSQEQQPQFQFPQQHPQILLPPPPGAMQQLSLEHQQQQHQQVESGSQTAPGMAASQLQQHFIHQHDYSLGLAPQSGASAGSTQLSQHQQH